LLGLYIGVTPCYAVASDHGALLMEIAPVSQPLTFEQCFSLALAHSESIAIDSEKIREAEARFLQAFGTMLPQVSFVYSGVNADSGRAFSSWHDNGGDERKFVFTQTLFSGFKEFASMAASRMENKQREYEKQRAEQLLFVDVSDAFYLLIEQQNDIKVLAEIRAALHERIDELKKREDIGRARRSEIVNTETQVYSLAAEIELVNSQLAITQALLSFLIGEPVIAVSDSDDTSDTLADEVNYTAKIDFRADVKAAEYAWGVAKKAIRVAQSGFSPTVTVEGDYYDHRNSAPVDQRWATTLKVDLPIFEGTTTMGAVKLARAQARESELTYVETRRRAVLDIHDAYVRAQAAIVRTRALTQALTSAELNYSLQRDDYRQSLVSNLDVLTALQNLGVIKRTYIHSVYEKKRYYRQLQAAVGDVGQER